MELKDTAMKKIKGFSSAYPKICNLKVLPNMDKTWITIQDDVGTSMTIKLSDLSDFICCEDCISREAVEKITWEEPSYTDALNVLTEVREKIRQLPSVKLKYTDEEIDKAQAVEQAYVDKMVELAVEKTKRPKGKWMECGGDEPWLKGYCCSLCNFTTTQKYDYCTCGAEMIGGEEE